MKFLKIDEEAEVSDIVKVIEDNVKIASGVRSEIEKLQNIKQNATSNTSDIDTVKTSMKSDNDCEDSDDCEDMINYYLDDYKKYVDKITVENLLEIIPSRSNFRFFEIVMRLQAESIKEIKELEELAVLENDKDMLLDIKKSIICEQEKINCLKEILEMDEDKIVDVKHKNKIYLVPNLSGKIMIIDDLEHISMEYYDLFLELINSIIDNTFKGVKRFTNNSNLDIGISEVRGNAVRILFQRLDKDTYALITAFIKKTNSSHGYLDYVRNKVAIYKSVLDYIKESLKIEDSISENERNIDELMNLLNRNNVKTYRKGDIND